MNCDEDSRMCHGLRHGRSTGLPSFVAFILTSGSLQQRLMVIIKAREHLS